MWIFDIVRYLTARIRCRIITKKRVAETVNAVGGYPIKLHLGCGGYIKTGWINCDLNKKNKQILPMDLLRAFPFPDGSVRFCYAEHVLEHLSINELRVVLNHIFKSMQDGAVFRIAQPNLLTMVNDSLSSDNWMNLKQIASAIKDKDIPTGTHYINSVWNEWGHKFNHSYESMKYELVRAGFRNVTVSTHGKSEYPELSSLEQRTPEDDSLICEATK